MNVKITAPYPRFRIRHMKFNASAFRYCTPEDIRILKKTDPNIGIFKDSDGKELNPKPKPKTKKREASDVHKDTKHKKQ